MSTQDPRESPFDASGPEQDRVRSLLAGLQDPGPMPEDLVRKIQARLADEALQAETGAHVVDLGARRRMRRMGWVAAVGGLAAAAGVTGIVLNGPLLDRDASSTSAFEHVARPSTTTSAATSATKAATTGPSGPVLQIRVLDKNVTAAQLDAEASQLLQENVEPMRPGTAESPTIGPLGTPAGLADCLVQQGIQNPGKVAAELVRYEGTPAVVMGLRTADGELQSWALDRSCRELVPHRTIS